MKRIFPITIKTLQTAVLVLLTVTLLGMSETPPEEPVKKEAPEIVLPDKPDERFFFCLERLLNLHGRNPAAWPEGREKEIVFSYLKDVHGVDPAKAVYGRNFLGLGIGQSPDQARHDTSTGLTDAWGMPYDLVMASSRSESNKWDLLRGIAINQGLGLFNPELAENTYVFLKLDLHSQFADVFKNFNGISAKIIAREVNFLGAPGSAGSQYADQIKPALTAADALRASIYVGDKDQVALIIPKVIDDLAQAFGVELPQPASPRRATGPFKQVPVSRVELDNCTHNIDDYYAGMKKMGATMLTPSRRI